MFHTILLVAYGKGEITCKSDELVDFRYIYKFCNTIMLMW